jgi:CDP-glucose 4,6-dehydratase
VKIAASVPIDPDFWLRRRVLVTGHTGFKGAWLCLWLQSLGAHVTGLATSARREPSLYRLARVGDGVTELAVDLRDCEQVCGAVADSEPEVVVHLAAQPLVRRSLRDPVETFDVNVMGTVNVLEAVRRKGPSTRAVVIVTSDTCYETDGHASSRFVEDDRLGGADPYSSSKACVELLAASYRRSFFASGDAPRIATARAGNVIGGGDWGADRLVADAVRAVDTGRPMRLRNPSAVRPWQHVLSPLAGYLRLCEALCAGGGAARAWNFGPPAHEQRTAEWVIARLAELWDGELAWAADRAPQPAEPPHPGVDSSAAERELGWAPACDLEIALGMLVDWHRAHRRGADMRAASLDQIARLAAP